MPPRRFTAASTALGVLLACPSLAEARRPADDSEVLVRLPRVLFAAADRLDAWRSRLAADPTDLDAAVGLATDSMEIARREDDPRFLGHARAALTPWWDSPEPPLPVLRLRAKLRERDHDYAGALADQAAVLAREPDDADALVQTANLLHVVGDYAGARAAAERLDAVGEERATLTARLPLDVATGHAERALAEADRLLADAGSPPALLAFADAVGADAARALGRRNEAGRRYRAGLLRDPSDAYLLRGYTDLLLDDDRPLEVLPLTAPKTGDTGLLLGQAIAAKRAGRDAEAADARRRLADRFREIRLRGGTPHGRYESRFELEIEGDATRALSLALQNWDAQKQSRDARNVLEAALAAGTPSAADGVVGFLRDAGTRDADLQPLIERLEAGR